MGAAGKAVRSVKCGAIPMDRARCTVLGGIKSGAVVTSGDTCLKAESVATSVPSCSTWQQRLADAADWAW